MSAQRSDGPTAEQIASYERDGFVIVPEYLASEEVERLLGRFGPVFEHVFETGIAPDEVNYVPGVTPPERTRQLCNVWKADRTIAATTLSARNAAFATAQIQANAQLLRAMPRHGPFHVGPQPRLDPS